MLVILFAFLYRKYNVRSSRVYAVKDDLAFGFKKGGSYNITILNPSTSMIFGLFSKFERKSNSDKIWDITPDYHICKGEKEIAEIQRKVQPEETVTLSGIITTKGVYYPFFYGCNRDYNFKLIIDFRNGDSCLDYRYYPCTIYAPIFVALYCILLVLWLVNWFMHFTLEIKIHYFLTTCFVLSCVLYGLNYSLLLEMKKNGFVGDAIYYCYQAFRILETLFQLTTLILAAKGWYIITKNLAFSEISVPIVFGAIYVVCNGLLNFVSFGFFDFLIAIGAIVCLVLYIYYLTKFVNQGLRDIKAHIIIIKNNGIDPKTTPVYSKYRMYKLYYKALITYATLICITIVVDLFASSLIWVSPLLDDISNFVLMCFLFYIFMIRQKRNNGYLIFDDGDVEEFSQQDLQSMEVDKIEGGNEWDESTPLPPQPVVVPDDGKPEKKTQDPENPKQQGKSAYGNPIVAPNE